MQKGFREDGRMSALTLNPALAGTEFIVTLALADRAVSGPQITGSFRR